MGLFSRSAVVPIDVEIGTAGTPIAVGANPRRLAIVPDGGTLLVARQGGGGDGPALVPLDVATGVAGAAIALPGAPFDAAVTPDGSSALVTLPQVDAVVQVDLTTGAVGTPIAVSSDPRSIAITPDGETALVTHFVAEPDVTDGPDVVTPIDVDAGTAGAPLAAGEQPFDVAIEPDGSRAWVTLHGNDALGTSGVVSIELADLTVGDPILFGARATVLGIRPTPGTYSPTVAVTTTPGAATGGGGWFSAADLGTGGTLAVRAFGRPSGGLPVASVSCTVDAGAAQTASGDELALTPLGDGAHAVSCVAIDGLGGATTPPSQRTLRVDATPPTLAPTITGSGPGGAVLLGDPSASAVPHAADATSGVATAACQEPQRSAVGPTTSDCTATDVAGNQAGAQATAVVQYLLVTAAPTPGTSVNGGTPVRIELALHDAAGAAGPACAACAVEMRVVQGGAGAWSPMSYQASARRYRGSPKTARTPTGPASVELRVRYPGTATATVASIPITIR